MTMTTVSSQESVPEHMPEPRVPEYGRFTIGFDPRDRVRFHALIDEVIDSGQWSEGDMVARLEAAWELYNGIPAVAMSSWAGGALAALHFAGVKGETVLCPSNTFMATPLAAVNAGASVEFVDCNREDLCMSFKDFEAKADKHKPQSGVPRPHRGPSRVRGRGDRSLLLRERHLPDRRLRPRPRRRMERTQAGHAMETPASTRCMRPRRSRPVRAGYSSRTGRRSSTMLARSATTASPPTRSRASTSA